MRTPLLASSGHRPSTFSLKGGRDGLPLRVSNEDPLFPFQHYHTFAPKGVTRLSFTARVGRAHSDRARSASKKDGLVAPYSHPSKLASYFSGMGPD